LLVSERGDEESTLNSHMATRLTSAGSGPTGGGRLSGHSLMLLIALVFSAALLAPCSVAMGGQAAMASEHDPAPCCEVHLCGDGNECAEMSAIHHPVDEQTEATAPVAAPLHTASRREAFARPLSVGGSPGGPSLPLQTTYLLTQRLRL